MTKLYELLQLRKRQDGDFGIEIECEGKNLAVPIPDVWNTVDDGSLRGEFPHGRAEWVLKKPLSLDEATKAVADLAAYQAANKAQLDFSFRTSVHVHMNVQNLTFNQYLNVIYTYLLLENVLVRYCGNDRIGNRFCLRMQDAEGLSDLLVGLFNKGPKMMGHFSRENVKYASINLAATNAYGSLEFRAMQGNLQVDYINTWVKALYNLREFAKARKDPQDIHDYFVRTDPSEFMANVLKDTYNHFSYEDEVNDIRQAFSITLELPYAYSNDEKRKKEREAELERRERELKEQYEFEQARVKQRMENAIRDLRNREFDLEIPQPIRYNDLNLHAPQVAPAPRVRRGAIVNQVIVDEMIANP